MRTYIGIDLGGTNIKAIALREDGHILQERNLSTMAEMGSDYVISRMAQLVFDISQVTNRTISAVGVAVPGVLLWENGIVVMMTNFPPDQWRGVRLKEILEKQTNLPFALLNDARAATLGEKEFGAGKPFRDFICLTIGTGVGGGIISDNKLLLGSRGMAGEIGHQVVVSQGYPCGCGIFGCLETVASGPAIVTFAARYVKQGLHTKIRDMVQGDLNRITPEIVTLAASDGDQAAIHIIETVAKHITTALLNMKAVLNPEAVILGGGIAKSEILLDRVKAYLNDKEILFPNSLGGMEVIRAQLDHLAGAYGAAAWAMKEFDRKVGIE